MSIRKSLMHYFDKATNTMIPFHPQTESGAITDWHESVIGSLASKVLPTVVSELTTDSVMGKLMKMLLTASGVKYSIDTNGYVCLGSFFGGLIIQWVRSKSNKQGYALSYPVTMTTLYTIVSTNLDMSSTPVTPSIISCFQPNASNVRLVSSVAGSPDTYSIIIGK
ncbi:hypothetical protein [Acidaminococcus fermentans]|uniref:hypothetical protein n=1 Tax=Acidaminococcus fermentans TaxID=905 RepID=UPI003A8E78EC